MSERLQTCQCNKSTTDSLVSNKSKLLDKNRKPLVSRPPLIQTRLAINQPGDEHEQEADRVAKQVMRMSDPVLQRKCAKCDEDEKKILQAKESSRTSIGTPGPKCTAPRPRSTALIRSTSRYGYSCLYGAALWLRFFQGTSTFRPSS